MYGLPVEEAEALRAGLLDDFVPASLGIRQDHLALLVRIEHTEIMHLAGGGVVGRIVDVQLCTGERVGCYAVLFQNRQGGLDRVEKGHRAGAAGLQIDHLRDLGEDHIRRPAYL